MKFHLAGLALLASPVLAAPPVPDPRLEVALSTNVISQIHRSVQVEKNLPSPALRARPAVHEPEMAQARDDVYIDRALLPPRPSRDEREAVRVYRRNR